VFVRLHMLETTREQYEVGLEILIEEYLPWARDSSGFRGLIALADKPREKTIVLSLWADEAALDASAAAGDRFGRLGAAASGSTRRSLESFEVTLFEMLH
jgi:hypothetical protein